MIGRTSDVVTINDIRAFLNALQHGNAKLADGVMTLIHHARSIDMAGEGDVTFCRSTLPNAADQLRNTRASMVIVDQALLDANPDVFEHVASVIVPSANARLDFLRVVQRFFPPTRPSGIHPSAVIAPDARLAADVHIGPLCTIGSGVEIGAGTSLHAGVHVYDNVTIGAHVTIFSGVVLGCDGFGYERLPDGGIDKFPHLGNVVIEDDVEIGANTVVDRATLGSTRIGSGTRIDKLVHIAHNCQIGRRCLIVAGTLLGGSVVIGDDVWVGTGATVSNQLSIGARAFVSLGTVAIKSVNEGQRVIGRSAGFVELPKA
jgi:UDP-3-O-[3-hydroxymyristoyl] glucosamine N-acyltransferase